MDLQEIVQQLMDHNILESKPIYHEQLNGGTVSELYLLHFDNIKYVIKINEPQIIKSESIYLRDYKNTDLLPKLLFVGPSYKYIVYSFIEGTTNYAGKNKKEILQTLVQGLINHYEPVDSIAGWGWAEEPSESWQSFIVNNINEANKVLQSRLDNSHYNLVLQLAEKSSKGKIPFLLHGDCGVHNFIFHNGQLSGVIDPSPVIGEPLYDLIYAFCSSPDGLTKETIDSAVTFLKFNHEINQSILYEEVLIGLYLRLAACIKHHPEHLDDYLKSWDYWVEIVNKD